MLYEDITYGADDDRIEGEMERDEIRMKERRKSQREGQRSDDVTNEESDVWLMLHSGSRRIGNLTATHWDGVAKRLNGSVPNTGSSRSGADALHWLWIDSKEGEAYLNDMLWCQEYALENRAAMMRAMSAAVDKVLGKEVVESSMISTHHNYCTCEMCKYVSPETGRTVSENLWVTRKGATSAKRGELGIIPGSMATGSFIVEGQGNPDSWQSCSHGSGRTMSRTEAKKTLHNNEFFDALRKAKVVCDMDPRLKDEAPQAYKNLDSIIDCQVRTGLVQVKHRLLPILNVKGF